MKLSTKHQDFIMKNIYFSYAYSTQLKHNLSGLGPLPLVSKGTHVIIPLVDHLEDERWEAKVVEQNGNKIKLSVNSTANAVIGLYGLTVMTSSVKDEAATAHNSNKNIIMLFNPWCEGKVNFKKSTFC